MTELAIIALLSAALGYLIGHHQGYMMRGEQERMQGNQRAQEASR